MLSDLLRKCLCVLLMLKCSEAARIFSYQPVPYDSHQRVFHVLTGELARAHRVLAFSALAHPHPPPNLTEIDVHDVSYDAADKCVDESSKHRSNFAVLDYFKYLQEFAPYVGPLLDLHFRHPQLRNLIENKSQEFELILVESQMLQGVKLCARFDVPVVMVSAMTLMGHIFGLVGVETNPYFYPDYMFTLDGRNSSFWEKLYYLYSFVKSRHILHSIQNAQDARLQKYFGPRARSIAELKKHVRMIFLNVHRYWDNNRPVPIGSVLYMGGVHLTPPRRVPQDLNAYLEQCARAVVVINFGSKVRPSRLPARTLRTLLGVFAQLPYEFLWKWDAAELPGKPANVRIEKSLPLNDLLHHPAVGALLTHGGLLSAHEALAAAVPVLCLPLMPDQLNNARQYEKLGIGLHLSIDSLDHESFKSAIVALVENKEYRERARVVSRIVADVREPPLRTAARWATRAAGPAHRARAQLLRCPRADAHTLTFYMLDVALAACVCLLFAAAVIAAAVTRLIAVVCKLRRGPLSTSRRAKRPISRQ